MWFECKIRYEKLSEGSVTKKVTETYLVEGSSHAEAEVRFATEMEAYVSGPNEIVSVRKVKIGRLLMSEVCDTWWWKARVVFVTRDEHTGSERRQTVVMLVQGDDIGDAVKALHEDMRRETCDREVVGLAKTGIMDVIVRDGKA